MWPELWWDFYDLKPDNKGLKTGLYYFDFRHFKLGCRFTVL